MNNDGETIHSEEDRKLVDDFRDRDAKEEDRLAMVNAREQARQFNRDHGDFPESDTDDDYRFKNIKKYAEKLQIFFFLSCEQTNMTMLKIKNPLDILKHACNDFDPSFEKISHHTVQTHHLMSTL